VLCWFDSLTSLSRERVRHVSDTELLHKSKGEPVRRLEVFTGSGRRRAWSAEQKARILTESYESGDEVSAVARRHGLTPQQLFGWRRDVRRRSTRRQSNDAAEMSFAPVLVETGGPQAGPPVAPSCPTATGTIEIALGAAVVRVGPGTDLATLTKVLRAVKAAT
jgi:transposase